MAGPPGPMTPHGTAIKYNGASITYGQLNDRVNRAAHALQDLGVRPGDRIAYLGPNHPAFLETLSPPPQLARSSFR